MLRRTTPGIALIVAVLMLTASVSMARSTLDQVRVYEYYPEIRVVLDLDRLAIMEIEADEAAGEVIVSLTDTVLGESALPLSEDAERVVTIGEPRTGRPLEVRVTVGAPLARVDHFTLASSSQLVLDLDRVSEDGAASREIAVWTPRSASDEIAQSVMASSEVRPRAVTPEETFTLDGETSLALAMGDTVGLYASGSESVGLPMMINFPPDYLIASGLPRPVASPEEVAQDGSRDRSQERITRLLGVINRMGGEVPQELTGGMSPLDLQGPLPRGVGPEALTDNYEFTPPSLMNLPAGVADEFMNAVMEGDRDRAVRILTDSISRNQSSEFLERMAFLIAEQRHLQAMEADPVEGEAPDWMRAINAFRYVLRHYPESEWVPLAWTRIYQMYLQMGWEEEALGALESFQRADTEYSLGKILVLQARLLEQMGRTDDMIVVLAQHLELDPNGPTIAEAYRRLGIVFRDRGLRLAAYNALRQSWELDPSEIRSDLDHWPEVIEVAIQNADHPWAVQMIGDLLIDNPGRQENVTVHIALARIQLEREEYDDALLTLEDIHSMYEESADWAVGLYLAAEQRRSDDAAGIIRAEVLHPAYINPIWGYRHIMEQWPDADLAQAAQLRLASLMAERGDADQATILLANMAERWPDSPLRPGVRRQMDSAMTDALRRAFADEDSMEAVRIHSAATAVNLLVRLPADVRWNLARAYADLGLWEQSASISERLLQEWDTLPAPPDLPWADVLEHHVRVLAHCRRLGEALDTVDRCLELFPGGTRETDLLFARAEILHDMHRWADCEEAASAALLRGGTLSQRVAALFQRGSAIKHTLGDEHAIPIFVEALQAFQRTGRTDLSSAVPYEIVFQLADCLYGTANWDRARRVYEDLITRYPNAPEIEILHYRLAQCLARLGQHDLARDQLALLRASGVGSPYESLVTELDADMQALERYPELFSPGGVMP